MNSGKWIIMSFKCPTGETALGEVERVCLELFHVVPLQNGRVTEICSEEILRGLETHRDGRFPFLM